VALALVLVVRMSLAVVAVLAAVAFLAVVL
jgi:hypothetical protein